MPGSIGDKRCPTCNQPLAYTDTKGWTCINPDCAETHPKPAN